MLVAQCSDLVEFKIWLVFDFLKVYVFLCSGLGTHTLGSYVQIQTLMGAHHCTDRTRLVHLHYDDGLAQVYERRDALQHCSGESNLDQEAAAGGQWSIRSKFTTDFNFWVSSDAWESIFIFPWIYTKKTTSKHLLLTFCFFTFFTFSHLRNIETGSFWVKKSMSSILFSYPVLRCPETQNSANGNNVCLSSWTHFNQIFYAGIFSQCREFFTIFL